MKIFQVTSPGLPADTGSGAHRRFTVKSDGPDLVHAAIAGTYSKFDGELEGESGAKTVFELPKDLRRLRSSLMFMKGYVDLAAAHAAFMKSALTPLAHGRERERAIVLALESLALETDVQFDSPLHIDSRGELSLHVIRSCGGFGETFSSLLNKHNPRCGVLPGAIMEASAKWCNINHFDAERLIYEAFELKVQAAG